MAGTRQPRAVVKAAPKNDEQQIATPKIKLKLRLRIVAIVDFRFGVLHHYDDLKRRRLMSDLADDECALIVSQTGRRLAFLFPEMKLERGRYEPTRAIASFELRLEKMTPWNPGMLSVYADRAGIDLVGDGIKRFEEALAKYADERDKAA